MRPGISASQSRPACAAALFAGLILGIGARRRGRLHGEQATHYLELLAETGVIGLGLSLAVVFACLAAARRAARAFDRLGDVRMARVARAVLLADVGILATQVFQSSAYDMRYWVVLALGPAFFTIAYRRFAPGPDVHARAAGT